MNVMKKVCALLLTLLMAASTMSGCAVRETVANEPLPETTSSDLGVYVNGTVLVKADGTVIDEAYTIDEDGNVVDAEGKVLIAAANLEAFTCVTEIKLSETPVKHKLEGKESEDGEVLTRPSAFKLKFSVLPEEVLNSQITMESYDPGALYFPYDKNEEILIPADMEAPADNILPAITLQADDTGTIEVTVVSVFDGSYELVVKNVLGEEIAKIPVEVSVEMKDADDQKDGEMVDKEDCVHDYEKEVVAPTIHTQGYTLYTCKNCGYSYRGDYVAKLEHTHEWDEGRVIAATYAARGYTLKTCKICGKTEKSNYTPVLTCDHSKMRDTVVPATCTKEGYTLHECMICKLYSNRDNIVPALGHDWDNGTVTTEPTCEKVGVKTYHCKHDGCEETKTDSIKALGHTWDDGVVSRQPTCSQEGEKRYSCVVCNQIRTESIAKVAHSMTEAVVAPTYTEQGYTRHYCTVCGYETAHTNITPVVPHEHQGNWIITVQPTCGSAGKKEGTCTICGQSLGSESIPATGNHNYADNTVAADCEHGGYTTHTCTVCGKSYTDGETAALGHDFVAHTEQTVIGTELHTICATCGMDFTANGFSNDAVVDHAKAHVLAGEGGRRYETLVEVYGEVTTYTCSRCGVTK